MVFTIVYIYFTGYEKKLQPLCHAHCARRFTQSLSVISMKKLLVPKEDEKPIFLIPRLVLIFARYLQMVIFLEYVCVSCSSLIYHQTLCFLIKKIISKYPRSPSPQSIVALPWVILPSITHLMHERILMTCCSAHQFTFSRQTRLIV